jgi:hypothetical protein
MSNLSAQLRELTTSRMRRAWSIAILPLLACVAGCGDGDALPSPHKTAPPSQAAPESEYSLKIFVEHQGVERLVKVGPVGAALGPAKNLDQAKAAKPPPQHTQSSSGENLGKVQQAATVGLPDSTEVDTDGDVVPGWTLLKWAATSCALEGLDELGTDWGKIVEPWSPTTDPGPNSPPTAWYIFENAPGRTCDAYLYREEQLLCTADRLAQIGDSPGTVYWGAREYTGTDPSTGAPTSEPIKVTIPPQATKDKFIARDMALNALGHLARLTMREHRVRLSVPENGDDYGSKTCGAWYADVANTGEVQTLGDCHFIGYVDCQNAIFPYTTAKAFDGDEGLTDNLVFGGSLEKRKEVGRRRVDRLANLMTAAARLTSDIVERSVKDDISGAQKAFASAGDRHRAALRAWGLDVGQEPYNNLRHALRTLYGRLELGPSGDEPQWEPHGVTRDDPRCDKASADTLMATGTGRSGSALIESLAFGLDARWDDIPPATSGESLALSILSSAGIVFAPTALGPNADLGAFAETVRPAIQTMLVRRAAQRGGKDAGMDYDAASDESDRANAVRATLSPDAITSAELGFAIERVYDAFRVASYSDALVGQGTPAELTASLRSNAESSGMTLLDSDHAPEIEEHGGVVLTGSLPRTELAEDLMARMVWPQTYSDCGIHADSSGGATARRARALGPFAGDVTAMQNPFMLGDALRRQMLLLATQLEATEEVKKTTDFLKLSAAETRQWAGPGVIVREYDGTNEVDRFHLIDITPEDLGVADDDELAARLVVTRSGSAERAACLAGTRNAALCAPDLFDASSPHVDYPVGGIVHEQAYPGTETYVRSISFPHTTQAEQLVLIAKDAKPGRVLGSLRGTSRTGELFSVPLSNLQHRLTQDAFGVGREATPERTCSATPSLATPRKYCVEGMDREQFAPLANELTSMNSSSDDSWRHYLDVAKAAAAKADQLAKEMVETGLSSDIRKESAGEEVANLCGSFPHDANASVRGTGTIATSGDQAVDNCLNPSAVDIVFLSEDPLSAPHSDAEIAANNGRLCNAFCKDQDGVAVAALPWCTTKCVSGYMGEITHAGLGLTEPTKFPEEELDPLAGCWDLANTLYGSDQLNIAQFSAKVREPWVNQATFQAALDQITLHEEADRSWYLQAGDKKMVESLAPGGNCQALTYPDPATANRKAYQDEPGNVILLPGVATNIFPNGDTTNCNATAREDAELAVYYLGAMAEGIPAGRIQMPVPAVNFSRGVPPNVHPTVVYSSSIFDYGGDGDPYWRFTGTGYNGYAGLSLADKEWMPWVPAGYSGAQFFLDRARQVPELPALDWRYGVYSGAAAANTNLADSYLALPTSNAAIRFGTNLVGGDDPNLGGNWTENNSRAYLSTWLEDVGRDYVAHRLETRVTAHKIEQAAWQQPGQAAQRSACDRAYVLPVFEKNLDGNLRPFIATSKPLEPTPDKKCAWYEVNCWIVAAAKEIIDLTSPAPAAEAGGNMMETIGREGGPSYSSWVAGDPTLQSRWNDADSGAATWNLAHDRLLPTQCAPSERLELFLRTEFASNQQAMHTLVRALTLACVVDAGRRFEAKLEQPPTQLQSMEDLRLLENWLALYARAAKQVAGGLFLVGVPVQSLQSVANGVVGVGAVSQGEQGKLYLELEENLRQIGDSYRDMGALFEQLAGEIRVARLQIEAAQLQGESRELALALSSIDTNRSLALSAVAESRKDLARTMDVMEGLTEVAGGATKDKQGQRRTGLAEKGAQRLIGSARSGIIDINIATDDEINQDFGAMTQANLAAQAGLSQQLTNNSIAQVIGSLGVKVPGIFTGISDQLTAIKNNVSNAEQNIISLRQNQAKAAIAVAKATGADFVEQNGELVPLHVNTVYRRQFDVLKLRYERALESAKRAAYLARLAIEERLGVRLDDLQSPIGPLEAPKLWVDDLCTVQGVDYKKLRTAVPRQDPSGAAEVDKIAGFADQYIGDYVAKLEEFVEFYNVAYPFKESRDSAILSLRESLGDADARCIAPSNNLLFFSDHLEVRPSKGQGSPTAGWRASGCSKTSCLDVRPGATLKDSGVVLEPPSNPGAATWLAAIARDAAWEVTTSSVPPDIVFQSVELRAGGSYVLSWWDQARTAAGHVASGSTILPAYPVRIYDAEWRVVSSDSFTPAVGAWSERRTLMVTAPSDGTYHVAFAAAEADLDPTTTPANVAIANVQLEGGGSLATSTAYAQTGASRIGVTSKCTADEPQEFRKRFEYKCDASGCYYELRDLLQLDTQLLQQGYSALTGKVGSGNYNYRLGTVALNLVGTGLLDCAQAGLPSCYSTGYIEYDLSHEAPNVPIEDYSGKTRCFDFATGKINGGKALATERVLTLPLSSMDSSLVNQQAISKGELIGRPLSGTYRLRIKESPGLVWQNLEDVQLLVNYEYWSRVSKSGG